MEVFDLPVWEVKFVRAYEDKLRVLETPEFKKVCGSLKFSQVFFIVSWDIFVFI